MSRSKKAKPLKGRVLAYLQRTRKRQLTYGEIAKDLKTGAMAVGQCLKALGDQGHKRLTNRVKSKRDSAA